MCGGLKIASISFTVSRLQLLVDAHEASSSRKVKISETSFSRTALAWSKRKTVSLLLVSESDEVRWSSKHGGLSSPSSKSVACSRDVDAANATPPSYSLKEKELPSSESLLSSARASTSARV